MHLWYVNKTKKTTDNDNNDNNKDNNCLYYKLQIKLRTTKYGSGNETAAVLLPGFAISW